MIVSVYAGLLAILYVALSIRTLLLRRTLKIGIGDGDNKLMIRAMRVHSNFAEYVPFALILALLIELSKGHWAITHFVCSSLLIGRCLHAYGVSKVQENYSFRVAGMAFTFTSICSSALVLLAQTITNT